MEILLKAESVLAEMLGDVWRIGEADAQNQIQDRRQRSAKHGPHHIQVIFVLCVEEWDQCQRHQHLITNKLVSD